jgi:eukaryotic-like serine/threonine-protein kinase
MADPAVQHTVIRDANQLRSSSCVRQRKPGHLRALGQGRRRREGGLHVPFATNRHPSAEPDGSQAAHPFAELSKKAFEFRSRCRTVAFPKTVQSQPCEGLTMSSPSSPPPGRTAKGTDTGKRKETLAYGQAPQRAAPKIGTLGYENAMLRWQAGSLLAPNAPPPKPEAAATVELFAPTEASLVRSTDASAPHHEALAPTLLAGAAAQVVASAAVGASSVSSPSAPSDIAASGAATTLAASPDSAPGISVGPGLASFAGSSLARSTVLPRIEIVGNEPTLVRDDRARYQHVDHLGAGGVGEVLKAQDNDIGRSVAVKRLLPDMQSAPLLVRFMQEIRTIGQLEHPNIVPIHDVGVDERGEYYFVMKYVQGETIESIIAKLASGDRSAHANYPFERRVAIFEQILEAIHYAHVNGIIHRDIKPSNIMVGPYGEVVVMDWGIAKRVRGDGAGPDPHELFAQAPGSQSSVSATGRNEELFRTRHGALIGTPAYMSPEQARGEPIDERSDVYSLCVLLHEFLCLKHYLVDKQTMDELLAGVKTLAAPLAGSVSSPYQPPTPMDLTWYVKKGLAKDPARRYQSVAEMIERLRLRRQGKIPIECHITFMKRMANEWARFIDRHPMLLTVGMVGAVLCAAGGVVLLIH